MNAAILSERRGVRGRNLAVARSTSASSSGSVRMGLKRHSIVAGRFATDTGSTAVDMQIPSFRSFRRIRACLAHMWCLVKNRPRDTSPYCDCTLIAPEQIPTSRSRFQHSREQFPETESPQKARSESGISKWREKPWDSAHCFVPNVRGADSHKSRFPGAPGISWQIPEKQIPWSGLKDEHSESGILLSALRIRGNCQRLLEQAIQEGKLRNLPPDSSVSTESEGTRFT